MAIIFRELDTSEEIEQFWEYKRLYEKNDIFPYIHQTEEALAETVGWFQSQEYYETIMHLHQEPLDGNSRLEFVFFYLDDKYLGFLSYKIYHAEDGKAFILDFSIAEPYRNKGLGSQVVSGLQDYLKKKKATYLALNTSNQRNQKFWIKQGFEAKEKDAYGEVIYILHL